MNDYTNEFVEEQMGGVNLDRLPHTKALLILYITWKYEDAADISNESLLREWWYLYGNNLLHELFTNESIYSPEQYEEYFRAVIKGLKK